MHSRYSSYFVPRRYGLGSLKQFEEIGGGLLDTGAQLTSDFWGEFAADAWTNTAADAALDLQYQFADVMDYSTVNSDSMALTLPADVAQGVPYSPDPAMTTPPITAPVSTVAAASQADLANVLLKLGPSALTLATKFLTNQGQIDTARAALERGRVPAGFVLNTQGQLIPASKVTGSAQPSILDTLSLQFRANPLPFIMGGVAIVSLLMKA